MPDGRSVGTFRRLLLCTAVVPALLLAGCSASYRARHDFSDLVTQGKFDDAENFYVGTTADYWQTDASIAPQVIALVNHYNAPFKSDLIQADAEVKAIVQSNDRKDWPAQKAKLDYVHTTIDRYEARPIWRRAAADFPEYQTLQKDLSALSDEMKKKAAEAFFHDDNYDKGDFFADYPTKLDKDTLFGGDPFIWRLPKLSLAKLSKLKASYPAISQSQRANDALTQLMIADTLQARLKTGSAKGVAALLAAMQDVGTAGLTQFPEDVVTVRQMQTGAPLRFVISVQGAPAPIAQDTVKAAVSSATTPYMLLIAPYFARWGEKATASSSVQSSYFAGYRTEVNPAYDHAVDALKSAKWNLDYQQDFLRSTYKDPNYPEKDRQKIESSRDYYARDYNNAIDDLTNTSPTIQSEVHVNYHFTTTNYEVAKVVKYAAFLVDRASLETYALTETGSEHQDFLVASGLRDDDDNNNAGLYKTRQDMQVYEAAPADLPIRLIIADREKFTKAGSLTEAIKATIP